MYLSMCTLYSIYVKSSHSLLTDRSLCISLIVMFPSDPISVNGTLQDEAEDTSMATASPEHSHAPNTPDISEGPTQVPEAPATPVTPGVPNGPLPTLITPNKGVGDKKPNPVLGSRSTCTL